MTISCQHGHSQCAVALLEAGADTKVTVDGLWTPLIYAATDGHTRCVLALLQAGVDKDATDDDDYTALLFACTHGHEACALALLRAGATAQVVTKQNFTTLMAASNGGLLSVVQSVLLLSDINAAVVASHPQAGFTALMYAAQNNHDHVVRVLIEAGAAVDPQLTKLDGPP